MSTEVGCPSLSFESKPREKNLILLGLVFNPCPLFARSYIHPGASGYHSTGWSSENY